MSSDMPDSNEQAPPAASGVTATQTSQGGPDAEQDPVAPGPERLPTRKDVSLRELLNKIDDYAPVVRNLLPLSTPANHPADCFRFPMPSHTTT